MLQQCSALGTYEMYYLTDLIARNVLVCAKTVQSECYIELELFNDIDMNFK